MKNQSSIGNFKPFAISNEMLTFIKGGSCEDLYNCIDTAIINDQVWLVEECQSILGSTCPPE